MPNGVQVEGTRPAQEIAAPPSADRQRAPANPRQLSFGGMLRSAARGGQAVMEGAMRRLGRGEVTAQTPQLDVVQPPQIDRPAHQPLQPNPRFAEMRARPNDENDPRRNVPESFAAMQDALDLNRQPGVSATEDRLAQISREATQAAQARQQESARVSADQAHENRLGQVMDRLAQASATESQGIVTPEMRAPIQASGSLEGLGESSDNPSVVSSRGEDITEEHTAEDPNQPPSEAYQPRPDEDEPVHIDPELVDTVVNGEGAPHISEDDRALFEEDQQVEHPDTPPHEPLPHRVDEGIESEVSEQPEAVVNGEGAVLPSHIQEGENIAEDPQADQVEHPDTPPHESMPEGRPDGELPDVDGLTETVVNGEGGHVLTEADRELFENEDTHVELPNAQPHESMPEGRPDGDDSLLLDSDYPETEVSDQHGPILTPKEKKIEEIKGMGKGNEGPRDAQAAEKARESSHEQRLAQRTQQERQEVLQTIDNRIDALRTIDARAAQQYQDAQRDFDKGLLSVDEFNASVQKITHDTEDAKDPEGAEKRARDRAQEAQSRAASETTSSRLRSLRENIGGDEEDSEMPAFPSRPRRRESTYSVSVDSVDRPAAMDLTGEEPTPDVDEERAAHESVADPNVLRRVRRMPRTPRSVGVGLPRPEDLLRAAQTNNEAEAQASLQRDLGGYQADREEHAAATVEDPRDGQRRTFLEREARWARPLQAAQEAASRRQALEQMGFSETEGNDPMHQEALIQLRAEAATHAEEVAERNARLAEVNRERRANGQRELMPERDGRGPITRGAVEARVAQRREQQRQEQQAELARRAPLVAEFSELATPEDVRFANEQAAAQGEVRAQEAQQNRFDTLAARYEAAINAGRMQLADIPDEATRVGVEQALERRKQAAAEATAAATRQKRREQAADRRRRKASGENAEAPGERADENAPGGYSEIRQRLGEDIFNGEVRIGDLMQRLQSEHGWQADQTTLNYIQEAMDYARGRQQTPDRGAGLAEAQPRNVQIFENFRDDPDFQALQAGITQAVNTDAEMQRVMAGETTRGHEEVYKEVNRRETDSAYDRFVRANPEKARAYAAKDTEMRRALERYDAEVARANPAREATAQAVTPQADVNAQLQAEVANLRSEVQSLRAERASVVAEIEKATGEKVDVSTPEGWKKIIEKMDKDKLAKILAIFGGVLLAVGEQVADTAQPELGKAA